MVSIVLPTYNGEKYIRESIESIINQTYEDWELIVIDDCSTDSTNSIVQEYVRSDSRVSLYKNEKNLRLPASLNAGFKRTQGEYLTWTSDDNIYKENAIEELVNVLISDPDCGFVFSREEYIDSLGKTNGKGSLENIEIQELFSRNIVTASFMYTREVYNQVGEYDTNRFLVEDYDYWLRIASRFKVVFLPKSLYYYRHHGESLTELKNKQVLESCVRLLEEELEDSDFTFEIKNNIYGELATKLFSLDRYDDMKRYIRLMKKNGGSLKRLPKKVAVSFYLSNKIIFIVKKLYKLYKRNIMS